MYYEFRDLFLPSTFLKFPCKVAYFQVFTCLDEPLRSTGEPLVTWPHVRWQTLGGCSSWDWMPLKGHRGKVVHKWVPLHPRRERRSHAGTIYLVSNHYSVRIFVLMAKVWISNTYFNNFCCRNLRLKVCHVYGM